MAISVQQAPLELDLPLAEKLGVVNVASVPQRSPFRYPGGKTWLVPQIRRWLLSMPGPPTKLIEPFAGGGIVSLTTAFENLTHDGVIMVELDPQVASVWTTILSGGADALADRIVHYNLTVENVQEELGTEPLCVADLAFQTILRNRVTHGGILAPGGGLLKHGENGRGISSRWYPETLSRRIRDIAEKAHRISFVHGDAFEVINQYSGDEDCVFFVDPPYTAGGKKAGKRLYLHSELDHKQLFQSMADVQGDFLMTYDNADDVKKLAEKCGFDTEPISMKNTHHAEMTELLIGRDLSWVRACLG